MPIMKRVKGLAHDLLAAEGLMYQDWDAVTPCQRECTARLGIALQREQEAYMTKHPEILAMLKIFMAKMTQRNKRKDIQREAAEHFTRSFADLDEEIRMFLESPADGPYIDMSDRTFYNFDDDEFIKDLRRIIAKHFPPPPWHVPSPPHSLTNTLSSSFISIVTSDSTLPTPEPVPTPEPTISEIFYGMVSNAVDKAIFAHVNEPEILYDTAYVELMKAVEQAMEIPVIEIRLDIATLFNNAYRMFDLIIAEKERLAAQEAWERRMRKKLKRSLRRQKNFKGYETPPPSTPSDFSSSQQSDQRPPPRPCQCQPLAHYNRYGKDRFGIYLPGEEFNKQNVTTTPVLSVENLLAEMTESKSLISKKSVTSRSLHSGFSSRSAISRRKLVHGHDEPKEEEAVPEATEGSEEEASEEATPTESSSSDSDSDDDERPARGRRKQ
ncbi:unnamed protein product [Chrysodeixis includens]|uniref:Uncharacterized protein n=1 Tax=Chrysodeixis includens TaxID=689277 RepID=A0A9P0FRJ2_CHRIL|nr:unnamed protein product [Chrysodeixis includens]